MTDLARARAALAAAVAGMDPVKRRTLLSFARATDLPCQRVAVRWLVENERLTRCCPAVAFALEMGDETVRAEVLGVLREVLTEGER